MLFSSFTFIFIFLPSVLFLFYIVRNLNYKQSAKIILIIASFIFYGYFKIDYVLILLSSIIINYFLIKEIYTNKFIIGMDNRYNKIYLLLGLIFNIGLLVSFKYVDFLLENFNIFAKLTNLDFDIPLPHILLPLALSFITFQQISFLIDCYNAKDKNEISINFIDYCLFVSFFPQLIAGPIVYHKEMMPQFHTMLNNNSMIYKNIAKGIFIFSIGLFKKVCIADSLSKWVNSGFDIVESGFELTFIHSWTTSLGYTFQLYFDFSGYCDMAIGLALLFSIKLPINFNSPYKATNIADFWRRWHITLGRFLKQYLYIPLGGNKINNIITLRNLFVVAFISGIWHGAGFGFIIWGILHGFALVTHRIYRNIFKNTPNSIVYKMLCIFITFNFVNISWIFFRSENISGALLLLKGMFNISNINNSLNNTDITINIVFITISSFIVFTFKNSINLLSNFKPNAKFLIASFIMIYVSVIVLGINKTTRFLYFNF